MASIARNSLEGVDTAPDGIVSAVVNDVSEYRSSVQGIDVLSLRVGRGEGPNFVRARRMDELAVTSVRVGFPMIGRTTIGDDHVAVATITAAPAGSRWCGIDLEPGQVIVYGQEARHTAMNLPGLEFTFVVVEAAHLDVASQLLGRRFDLPARGAVSAIPRTPDVERLSGLLPSLVEPSTDTIGRGWGHDAVLRDIVAALSDNIDGPRGSRRSSIDNVILVHACWDFAEALGRVPSVAELCGVTHVSERRLRIAFEKVLGMPPSRVFRSWGLGVARQRLLDRDATGFGVADVAHDVGFHHLGRFSGRYRDVFGEVPSDTLAHA